MNVLESGPLLLLTMFCAMGLTAIAFLKIWPILLPPGGAVTANDYSSIAGLRGLLAASVFIHHAQVSWFFFRDGAWLPLQSPMYTFAGTGSVALFFMITGFLFWGKLIDGRIAFLQLMRSRVRRIFPLYLFSFLLILAICAIRSGFTVRTGGIDLFVGILRWLCGGLLGSPDINGVNTLTINCGVTWTLQYEWVFYLVLPLLAVFVSPVRFTGFMLAWLLILFGLKKSGHEPEYQALVVGIPFVGGMLAAYAVRFTQVPAQSPWASGFVAASLMLGAAAYRPGYFTIVAVALFPAFTLVALGNGVFGLLRRRWLMFLGEISFSLYLLHGIILLTVLQILNRFVPVGKMPYYEFVAVCTALSVLVVLLSTLSFANIEKRFMKGRESSFRGNASGVAFGQ